VTVGRCGEKLREDRTPSTGPRHLGVKHLEEEREHVAHRLQASELPVPRLG
jgi:hypothetical protein